MAGKTSKQPTKSVKQTAAKKAAPRGAPKSEAAKKSVAKKAAAKPASNRSTAKRGVVSTPTAEPTLLSGGNPQIAKGYGEALVQAYIAAMPGWKSALGRRLDAIITRSVPGVHKAVKWNSPLYGVAEGHWFLGLHCFNKYVKVAFFRGASLRPLPPGASKQKEVRYLDIREDDNLDQKQFTAWVKQAAKLPGEKM